MAQAPVIETSSANAVISLSPSSTIALTSMEIPTSLRFIDTQVTQPLAQPMPFSGGAIKKNTVCAIGNTVNSYQNPISTTGKGRGRGFGFEPQSQISHGDKNIVPSNKSVNNFDVFANVEEVYPPIANYRINAHSNPNYAPII